MNKLNFTMGIFSKTSFFIIGSLLLFTACNKKQQKESGIITVDVTKHYPKMEAVPIQDIADVEYIPLETNDEFLCGEKGRVIYMDDDYILFSNGTDKGDVFIFDGSGSSISIFNRKGQGPEEYLYGIDIVFDKENKEIYIHDVKRTLVYDFSGQFKRKLSHFFENKDNRHYNIFDYDKEHLLGCYKIMENDTSFFALISKQTEEIVKEISLPFNELQTDWMHDGIDEFFFYLKIALKQDKCLYLNMLTTDTLYKLTPDFTLEPIVTRLPSIRKMASTWGVIDAETPNYRFMTLGKEGDSEFSTVSLVFDKRKGEISEQNFYNVDDLSKKTIAFGHLLENIRAIDNNRYYLSIPADQLKEAYENGELTGKLKEIASKITEDDNPVLMVVKFK